MDLEDLTSLCYGTLADERPREVFLAEEHRLSMAFSLVRHLPAGRANTDEVAFYQMVRKQLRKLTPPASRSAEDLERAVQDLLDESIAAQPAVDIFAVAGLEKPDISILDEAFLAGFKRRNIRICRCACWRSCCATTWTSASAGTWSATAPSGRCWTRRSPATTTAPSRQPMGGRDGGDPPAAAGRRAPEAGTGLSDEELGFYDVVAWAPSWYPHGQRLDRRVGHQVVAAVRANLKVDWT